jgi:transcriptional regulator with XRE-family HTH domain
MTLRELARRTGISPHTLRRIEEQRLPLHPDEAKRIAIVTGADAKKLLADQVVPAKKTNRDWSLRLDSAKIVFAALVDELLDVEAYQSAQEAFYDAAAARELRGEAAKTMDDADRRRELFYYLFSEWAAQIAEQFKLNGELRLLDRIGRMMDDQGIKFIVPESLLPKDRSRRQRWHQGRGKALAKDLALDDKGNLLETPFVKRRKEALAQQEQAFRNFDQRAAAELHGLLRSVSLSSGEKSKLGKLLKQRGRFQRKSPGVEIRLGQSPFA